MPRNFGSNDSKWSSERERQERERQRDAQKELLRQARIEREEKEAREAEERATAERSRIAAEEAASRTASTRRPLSDEDLAAARRLRGEEPLPPADVPSPSVGADATDSGRGGGIGRRWRSQVEGFGSGGAGGTGGPALPDLPGDSSGRRPPRGNPRFLSARVLTFGIILFLLMASFAFLPFGPFNNNGSNPTPSPTSVLADFATLPPGGTAEALAQPTANPNSKGIVCVDPGHGGWDTGYVRTLADANTTAPAQQESEINLGMGYMLKARLESMGYTVVMTRTTGENPNWNDADVNGDGKTIFSSTDPNEQKRIATYDDIQKRIDICNGAKADILISIHVDGYATQGNPASDKDVDGYEVIYTPDRPFSDQNLQLATDVYRRLSTAMTAAGYTGTGRNIKVDSELGAQKFGDEAQAKNLLLTGPAVNVDGLTIPRPSQMPAITCEPVFLSNDSDAQFISDPAHQQDIVDSYAQGIDDYFKKK